MHRIFIIFFLALYQLSSVAQISSTDYKLYRYVDNEVIIDNRFKLDSTNSEGQFTIRLGSKGKYYNKYFLKPSTKNRILEFKLVSKGLFKKTIIQKFRLRDPRPLKTITVYPAKNRKFDITRDFGLIRILMRSGPDVNYILYKNATHYNVTLPDGTLYTKTDLSKIDTVLFKIKPEYVIIDKVVSESEDFTFTSDYSDTIKFSYPVSVDTSDWCFDHKKKIIKISDENFKNSDDTIRVENNGCLYLKLNAGGSQNQFVLDSQEYEKEIIYNDIYGGEAHLVNISEEHGNFKISLVGDSSYSGVITIIID